MRRALRQGPPSQALWRLVSWELRAGGNAGRSGIRPHAPALPRAFAPGMPGPSTLQQPACFHSLPSKSPHLMAGWPQSKPFPGCPRASGVVAAAYVQCPGETGGASYPLHFLLGKVWVKLCIHMGLYWTRQGRWKWSRCGDHNGDVGGWNSSGTQYGHFNSIPCSPVNLELESGVPSGVGRGPGTRRATCHLVVTMASVLHCHEYLGRGGGLGDKHENKYLWKNGCLPCLSGWREGCG